MKYCINQIYSPEFNLKQHTPKDVLISHQQQNQERGIEQKKAAIKKREKKLRQRIAHNQSMVNVANLAKKNIAEGKVVKVSENFQFSDHHTNSKAISEVGI